MTFHKGSIRATAGGGQLMTCVRLITAVKLCPLAGGPDGDLVDLSQSPERVVGSGAGRGETVLTCRSALRGWSSRLDGESKLSEHLDGAGLPALEITGGKALARGELISRAQDCFRRVTAFVPDQIVSRGRSESMRREEPLRP